MNKLKPSQFTGLTPPRTAGADGGGTKYFNAAINRLSSQNSHHQVLQLYSSMRKTNTPPDAYTFPSVLKACTSLELYPLGLSLHQSLTVNGFSSDSYISSSLISFYSKFGCVEDARRVFDKMSDRSLTVWSAIIRCYSKSGDVLTCFSMFNDMREEGVKPNSVTILGLLCGNLELAQIKCLHSLSVVYGFDTDIVLMNSFTNVYAKCGSIEDGKAVFESMDRRDVISWNTLMAGYTQLGDFGEVTRLLNRARSERVELDQQSMVSLASLAATKGNLRFGRVVHGHILRAGYNFYSQVETSLVSMYLKCGDLFHAFCVFEKTTNRDFILWTTMISGLVQNGCADKAFGIFRMMLESGEEPCSETIASVLSACAQLGSYNLGRSIHGYMYRHRMLVDIVAQNSLITMYAKCCHIEQSHNVFERMSGKNVVSWNALIGGYAQNGHLCEALLFFNAMRRELQTPDAITLVSLLQACASIGTLQQGKWVHGYVVRSCLVPCSLVDTSLIDMYSKCGNMDDAQKCFSNMSQHDQVSWASIIAGYGSNGEGKTALRLYSEYLQNGYQPDDVVVLSALSACSHNGLVNEGLSIFESMTRNFRIKPRLEHCACIVDLLCRAGAVNEAYGFYKEMFIEPSIDVLGIVLDACRVRGNEELGNIIARDILKLTCADAGNYVQLVHSYASMNRWDSVGDTWAQIRSHGLKKLPAWSFIELYGSIVTFFAHDSSHPQSNDILLILRTFSWEMRNMAISLGFSINSQNVVENDVV